MQPSYFALTLLGIGVGVASCSPGQYATQSAPPPIEVIQGVRLLDQGPRWGATDRATFYTQDQGSRIVRLDWLAALPQPGAAGAMADGLTRYGYLSNPPNRLPVGFMVAGTGADAMVGMTCAACHTRQITVAGAAYRVDGGPAIVDFQSFLTDLDASFATVLASDAGFVAFATHVLGHPPSPAETATLQRQVRAWYGPYHTLMTRALPSTPWGPGRLDAVGMILDRVTGLDIGTTPDRVIAANIRPADAPVRYPFVWNASVQDHTQWPGFAANGNWLLALGRNVGEVYGVFADLAPARNWLYPIGYDYLRGNSANFPGLQRLNTLMTQIGPPRWPFAIDQTLVAKGAAIFGNGQNQGRCAGCHWPRPGTPALFGPPTWKTPILDVHTDRREYAVMGWTADTGVMNGAGVPALVPSLKPNDTSMSVLKVAVVGSILQYITVPIQLPEPLLRSPAPALVPAAVIAAQYPKQASQLTQMYDTGAKPAAAYEARVLQGIWAAAPYLHNGAVPTLADLLKPPAQRPATFSIGGDYDTDAVGLATTQTTFGAPLRTTADCDNPMSGASRCGHDYGTDLDPSDKTALLEYLKTL